MGSFEEDCLYICTDFSFINSLDLLLDEFNEEVMVGVVDGYLVVAPRNGLINTDHEDILKINRIVEVHLAEYLSGIDDNYLVLISVKDDASFALSKQDIIAMQNIGLEMDLRDHFRGSYYAISFPALGGLIFEESGNKYLNKSLSMNKAIGNIGYPVDINIVSAGYEVGNLSSIKIGGVEYSTNQRGINIVIYDLKERNVIEIAHFDTHVSTLGTRIIID